MVLRHWYCIDDLLNLLSPFSPDEEASCLDGQAGHEGDEGEGQAGHEGDEGHEGHEGTGHQGHEDHEGYVWHRAL